MSTPKPESDGAGEKKPVLHEVAAERPETVRSLLLRSPLALFILGLLTFLSSGVLLGIGSQQEYRVFWGSQGTRLWHLLLALQPALWLCSIAVVWREICSFKLSLWPGRKSRHRLGLALCTVLVLFTASLPMLIPLYIGRPLLPENSAALSGMPYFDIKIFIVSGLGTLAATLHSLGILCVHARLIDWQRRSMPASAEGLARRLKRDTRRYQQLRSQMRLFLGSAALIVGLAMLSTGSLRNLLNRASAPHEVFPVSLAMAYGLHFTALLAAIYLPAQSTLNSIGGKLAEQLLAQSLGQRTRWKEWVDEQRAIRAHLGLEDNALALVKDGISVLAPLVASLSSLLFAT